MGRAGEWGGGEACGESVRIKRGQPVVGQREKETLSWRLRGAERGEKLWRRRFCSLIGIRGKAQEMIASKAVATEGRIWMLERARAEKRGEVGRESQLCRRAARRSPCCMDETGASRV